MSYPEENTTVSVYVRPRVLGLTVVQENIWRELVDLRDKLEQGIVRQVLLGKLTLASETRVSFAQDGVAVTRQDASLVECIPDEVNDLLVSWVVAQDFDRFLNPD